MNQTVRAVFEGTLQDLKEIVKNVEASAGMELTLQVDELQDNELMVAGHRTDVALLIGATASATSIRLNEFWLTNIPAL